MASIDEQTVDRIAHLARLQFDAEEKQKIIKDLNRIIGFVDKLSELDTRDVEPLIYITEGTERMREDEIRPTLSRDEALKNAPDRDTDYFRVSKVVKK